MTRSFALLFITTTLFLFLACGGEQQGDSSLRDFILEDAYEIKSSNYKAQLDADAVPFVLRNGESNKEYKENIEDLVSVFGPNVGKVSQAIEVESPSGRYAIYIGEFDFEKFAETLNSLPQATAFNDWFQDGSDAWQFDDGEIFVVFPERGMFISGPVRSIQALRDAFSGGAGIADADSGFGKLLHRTDLTGLESEVKTDCSLSEGGAVLDGCVGVSWSLTDGDDDFAVMSHVVLLDSAENARAAAPKLQQEAEEAGLWVEGGIEFTDLDVDGDIVTFTTRRSE